MENKFIKTIQDRASAKQKSIVLPESDDPRVLRAAAFLQKHNICEVLLIGERDIILSRARKEGITLPKDIDCLNPDSYTDRDQLVEHLYNRRKHKGLSRIEAKELCKNTLYFAALLVATHRADGCVAGSVATSGEVIQAAIQSIGLPRNNDTVSSTFLMALKDRPPFTYADCGVVPYPDAHQLADIAVESARTHRLLTKEEPIVAMLSFSTKGSARHEKVDLVLNALERARQKDPDLVIDGEFQFDAAFVPEVAKRKSPDSEVAGKANVFIFPNLDAGNIAYKITERLAGASATGPILQGLAKPMMDLSRGCQWQDIVNGACVAILMADAD